MKHLIKIILLIASLEIFFFITFGFAQTNAESVENFLPKKAVTDAVYVQIEDDPALVDYSRRVKEAREKNPEWFLEYSKKLRKPGFHHCLITRILVLAKKNTNILSSP